MAASDSFVITDEVKWKAFLQLNRTRMVTDLNYDTLAEEALERKITNEKEVKRIKFNNTANFRRVGVFLDNLLKKTKPEYLLFRECLKQMDDKAKAVDQMLENDYPGYVRQLEEQMRRVRPYRRRDRARGDAMPVKQFEVLTGAKPEEIEKIKKEINVVQVPENFNKSSTQFYSSINKESYKISQKTPGKRRGRALMVTMTGGREGWKADVTSLAKMFKALDFDLISVFDPSYGSLQEELADFVDSDDNENADCVFVVFMGHGGQTGSNKEYLQTADGRLFSVEEEIQKNFNNEDAVKLQEKPKVFIVQMCRGDKEDRGVIVADAVPGGKRVLPTWSDFLFGYATLSGNKAFRDTDKGSWYIEEMVRVFLDKAHNQSVPDMLTEVNRLINLRDEHLKQAAVTNISLSHKLFLFPGI